VCMFINRRWACLSRNGLVLLLGKQEHERNDNKYQFQYFTDLRISAK
jgi:hypothetical protein